MNGGGPATESGKAVVRWNATRHGISSPQPVVPGLEKREDWEGHLNGIIENLSPLGHLEVTLAERVALLSWRLHRVTRYETGAIATAQEKIEDDIHERDRFLSALRQKGFESTHPVDIRFEALYALAITTGLRRGELLGLRWDDVDLERGTLRVGRALVREGGRHAVGETKTRRGRRQVNLTPRTVNALRAHRKRQLEEKVRLGGLYEDRGLIFTTQRGTSVNPENLVKRSFKPLLERAGLPEIRFHDLRHTCATLLLGRGVHPKLVQELLGHATIAMTLDTYSHYLPSMGDQAAGAMGDALG